MAAQSCCSEQRLRQPACGKAWRQPKRWAGAAQISGGGVRSCQLPWAGSLRVGDPYTTAPAERGRRLNDKRRQCGTCRRHRRVMAAAAADAEGKKGRRAADASGRQHQDARQGRCQPARLALAGGSYRCCRRRPLHDAPACCHGEERLDLQHQPEFLCLAQPDAPACALSTERKPLLKARHVLHRASVASFWSACTFPVRLEAVKPVAADA